MEYIYVAPLKSNYIPNLFKKVTFSLGKPVVQGAGQVYKEHSTGWKAEKVATHREKMQSAICPLIFTQGELWSVLGSG